MIRDKKAITGNRKEREESAASWLNELSMRYDKQVSSAMSSTYVKIGDDIKDPSFPKGETSVRLFKNDVVTCAKAAVTHNKGSRVCILNFASPSNPGGGFLKGSLAQEEAICHATGLYPCLAQDKCKEYYGNVRGEDRLHNSYIYTKDCPFIVNGKVYLVDVLTMAAVNRNISYNNPDALMEKCQRAAYLIPCFYCIDVLLLGAWGCGVFGNDPKRVAENWYKLTRMYNGLYKEVVHPIIDVATYKVFKEVFKR